jgi:hypothetical protein
MLGTIQLLPTMKLAELSVRAEMSYEQSLEGSLNYHNLITLFSPHFFGTLNAENNEIPYWGHGGSQYKFAHYLFFENCIYVGLSALIFGMFGIIALWKKRIIKFLATIALFSILFILGDNFILYKIFYDFVPGFDKFRYMDRFGLILPFSFSLLSAYGFDYFINNAESGKVKKFIKGFIILVSAFILLWLLFQLGFFKDMSDVYKNEKFYDNSIFQILKTVVILLVLLVLVFLYKKKTILQQLILLFFILLAFADFYMFGSQQNNHTIDIETHFADKKIVAKIKQTDNQKLYRIRVTIGQVNRAFHANQGMLDFTFLIDGYNPLAIQNRFPPHRTNDLMNVKYSLVIVDTVINLLKFNLNKSCMPRAWMSYYPIVESSLEKVARILEDSTFNIRRKVIIDQEPEIPIDTNNNIGKHKINIVSYQINEIIILVETNENGILVLSEVYYPNWKVFVDDVEKPMLRADYSLRGVALEKGNNIVVFKYVDKDFQLGAIISLFALVMVVGGFVLVRYYK